MATLSCDAKNCLHNDAPYCCISHICVGGTKAMTEAETCCDNFKEKGSMAMNSACGQSRPNPMVDIECKACHCVYNENYHCRAEAVNICGPSASVCDETRCATFQAK